MKTKNYITNLSLIIPCYTVPKETKLKGAGGLFYCITLHRCSSLITLKHRYSSLITLNSIRLEKFVPSLFSDACFVIDETAVGATHVVRVRAKKRAIFDPHHSTRYFHCFNSRNRNRCNRLDGPCSYRGAKGRMKKSHENTLTDILVR